VQLPLPPKINPYEIILSIDPKKDVDGFHPENVGKLSIGIDSLYPCTAIGVLEILKSIKCDLQNSHIAVLGRSNIVGRPLAHLLEKQNATVTLCHSFTKNLHEITSRCDVLISAIGKSNFITDKYVKNGAIVIDVGINFIHKEGKKILTGDIDFESVSKVASLITTVPGGVGPMTVSCLIANTLKAFKIQKDQVS
jgi:methylenetetrahydrofolate dehydrogenase (NADP+)/methenyltetrahydrofolate cyclohydrolase